MNFMERLLPTDDDEDASAEQGYNTRFWIAFSLLIVAVFLVAMFMLFYFVTIHRT